MNDLGSPVRSEYVCRMGAWASRYARAAFERCERNTRRACHKLGSRTHTLNGEGQSCGMLMPGDRSHSTASRSGSGYRSGLSSSALTTLKMAVLAPMAITSDNAAVRRSVRMA